MSVERDIKEYRLIRVRERIEMLQQLPPSEQTLQLAIEIRRLAVEGMNLCTELYDGNDPASKFIAFIQRNSTKEV